MAANDLTYLADVKSWLGIASGTSDADALLSRMITMASRVVVGYCNLDNFLPAAFSDRMDGYGANQRRILLRHFPVISVSSLMLGTVVVPAGVPPSPTNAALTSGWLLSPFDGSPPGQSQWLDLFGFCVPRGMQNIQVSYTAGYQVTGEAVLVPAGAGPFQPVFAQPYGAWGADAGATFASNGVALVKVVGAPAAGQYAVTAQPVTGTPTYTFNAADSGKTVLVSYGYIPADVAQAVIEFVAERYTYRGRIGQASKSLGGQETISFSLKDMQDGVKLMLGQY